MAGGNNLPAPLLQNNGGDRASDDGDGIPKAYLRYIFVPGNFDFSGLPPNGNVRVSEVAGAGISAPHELLQIDFEAPTAGHLYVYLSNENDEIDQEVFFDDFLVRHEKSAIVQMQEYYPFGLAFNSFSRENSLKNNYEFNGKEKQETGWLDFGARMYMPDVARWGVIDPLAERMRRYSPYVFAFDNPVRFTDPDGMEG